MFRLEMCTGVGMATYPPKPAGIPASMGKSFNLDPRSRRVWARHFAVMGFSPVPAVLQKPVPLLALFLQYLHMLCSVYSVDVGLAKKM